MRKYTSMSVFFIFFLCCAMSCGEFISSPYISKTKNRNINGVSLKSIDTRASEFTNSFKIAVLSDSHDYYTDLKKQVDCINAMADEIAFVMHTGDATNLGMLVEWETFRSFVKELKVPLLMVIGNHDMLTNGTSIYTQMFGKSLNYSFVFKQTKFILINNNNWESDGVAPDLGFVESELASSTQANKIILGHVQPDDTDRYKSSQINDMKNLVNTHNVNYFINGHNHNYGEGSFGTATRVTVGAAVKGKLLILNISDSGVTHSFINP